jgi:hypothetical protein
MVRKQEFTSLVTPQAINFRELKEFVVNNEIQYGDILVVYDRNDGPSPESYKTQPPSHAATFVENQVIFQKNSIQAGYILSELQDLGFLKGITRFPLNSQLRNEMVFLNKTISHN